MNNVWEVRTKPTIVFEDKHIVVINKPSGLITHPKNAEDKSYSVTEWLTDNYPESKSVGEDPLRPGIVHRLDRETSGLLVLAKTNEAFSYMKKLFQEHKIQKYYLALVNGAVKNDSGTIDLPIGRVGLKRTTRTKNGKLNDPKTAITEYKVLARYGQAYSLVEAKPKTGRTHQIRVHLKALGHPLVCDSLYGGKRMVCPPELGRLALHAQKLEFTAPDGKSMSVETDLPEDLQNFISKIQ